MAEETRLVLTKPIALDEESDGYIAPNPLQLVLNLLKNVRPGSDLTHFQMPPLFNVPKSQLQCFGELVYSGADTVSRCNSGEKPLDRFTAVVAWSISTVRPVIFGVAPYNPILGETHHISRGNLNVLLEHTGFTSPTSICPPCNGRESKC